jgi:transposase
MYIRLTKSKKSKHPTLQIIQGVRQGAKVKQKIVASLGVIKSKEDLVKISKLAENLVRRLEKEGVAFSNKIRLEDLIHKQTVYDGFGLVVDKLMQLTGFSDVIGQVQGKKDFDVTKIVMLTIAQRLDLPSSKLRTYERQEEHGFHDIDLQHMYRAMDAIEPLNNEIQKQSFLTICSYSENPVDCFFFDVTTLYFESVIQDELKDFGYSKDQKFHQVQIVLALVVDSQGIPIAYETFKGNVGETKTLIPVLELLRARFSIKNVTVVCDRGLASETNVQALKSNGFHFVLASKLRSMSKTLKINDPSAYTPMANQENLPDEEKIFVRTMEHPQYAETLLIATYSPKRAAKDRDDRERLIKKLNDKIATSSDEKSVKKVISNSGYKKYTNVKKGSLITINQKAIDEDAAWDGFHGIAVSNSANLTVREALTRYKELWHVEEAFRVAKSTLRARPIFHWKSNRIKSHLLLCFMTLFFERFLELLLRKNGFILTPDRIRHALAGVHTIVFQNTDTCKTGSMRSSLSEDATSIFKTLGISLNRSSALKSASCV